MNIEDARNRIQSRVWKTLAQSDLELKEMPKDELEQLVELVTNAALLEIDEEIGQSLADEGEGKSQQEAPDDGEEILWEGRPFLSINTRYVITSERVRLIEGVLGKDRVDIELVRIQDIDQSQSMSERLLNLGDIHIHSHDRSHPQAVLRNVKNPQKVHEILRQAVLAERKRNQLTFREEM